MVPLDIEGAFIFWLLFWELIVTCLLGSVLLESSNPLEAWSISDPKTENKTHNIQNCQKTWQNNGVLFPIVDWTVFKYMYSEVLNVWGEKSYFDNFKLIYLYFNAVSMVTQVCSHSLYLQEDIQWNLCKPIFRYSPKVGNLC
jgi:hypothetical protein